MAFSDNFLVAIRPKHFIVKASPGKDAFTGYSKPSGYILSTNYKKTYASELEFWQEVFSMDAPDSLANRTGGLFFEALVRRGELMCKLGEKGFTAVEEAVKERTLTYFKELVTVLGLTHNSKPKAYGVRGPSAVRPLKVSGKVDLYGKDTLLELHCLPDPATANGWDLEVHLPAGSLDGLLRNRAMLEGKVDEVAARCGLTLVDMRSANCIVW